MQRAFAVVAVVLLLLLGVIAWELYPIARMVGGILALGASAPPTAEQRRAAIKQGIEQGASDGSWLTDQLTANPARTSAR